ncbi:hypothetical protein J2W32_000342 [Variovorax boronicumulans]|uniref:Uncharacterized protein n=1 Tax=Variovorax boronicumulans TaxID=436515 RepID=A0AAW8CW84_9BURK|nr:hypothetical protein [Variovorax boronicumulans]MDP9891245.1 hypothetical protein [Variovorax boronicumulans]MDQ0051313.1 hypothetical protein [Variovorax boronicumulans]
MDTMTSDQAMTVAEVNARLGFIKDRMPRTYQAIQEKAAVVGKEAYALVRRGIRGEPNCFFACERDHKAGTPWDAAVPTDVARLVERYGMTFVCMWPEPKGTDGTH